MQIIIDSYSVWAHKYGLHTQFLLWKLNAADRSALSYTLFVFVCLIDQPELKQIDQILVKQSHAAATTFILEAVKLNADNTTIR